MNNEDAARLAAAMSPLMKTTIPNTQKIKDSFIESLNSFQKSIAIYQEVQLSNSLATISEAIATFNNSSNSSLIKQLTENYSEIVSPITSFYIQTLDLSKIVSSFESLIKEHPINSNQEIKEEGSPSDSKSKENIVTEPDKVKILNYAFCNFYFHVDRFKEVFHKSYSYTSERKVVVFGIANAFVYLVTTAAQIHPLLPFWIFSITSIIGLFMPSDK